MDSGWAIYSYDEREKLFGNHGKMSDKDDEVWNQQDTSRFGSNGSNGNAYFSINLGCTPTRGPDTEEAELVHHNSQEPSVKKGSLF